MKSWNKFSLVALAVVILLLMAQCVAPATPQKVVETVVVTKEVEVAKPVEVTKEVPVTVQVEATKEVAVTPTPLPGKSDIVIALPEEPINLDWSEFGASPEIIMETLIMRDGQTGELIPVLAESWKQLDPNTWRFNLRKGVKFTNGVPFDASIAKWNLETLSDPANNYTILQFLDQKLSVTAVDDYTIDVRTDKPDPILPRRLIYALMGEPSALKADPDAQAPIGTGSHMLKEWVHGERIVLVANPDYWGGESQIKQATFIWRAETSVRAAMLQAGEADIAFMLAPQDTGPIRAVAADSPETPFLFYDPNPPLDDLRVRQAICMAVDRDALARQIFGGYATPANSLVTPGIIGYNPNIPVFPYDPEVAKALLAEAKAAGTPIDRQITLYGRTGIYPNATEAMEAVALWLTNIGLNVKVEMQEVSAWREVNLTIPVPPGRVGIIQSSHGNDFGDAIFTIQVYYGPYGPPEWYHFDDQHGGARRPVIDPKIVELSDKAMTLTEEQGRAEALAEVFAYDHDHILWACPLVHIQDIYGISEHVDWKPRFDRMWVLNEIKLK